MLKQIWLAKPRGFCAGVERAIDIVERVLQKHGAPVYVKHEIVHNRHVVENFEQRGVIFVETPTEAPFGAVLVYSAHGVSQAVRCNAAARQQYIYDATCPLVTKVHSEVSRLRAADYEIIMVGHRGHPEVEGTLGQADDGVYLVEDEKDAIALQVSNPERLAYVTQTTLSVDDTARLVAVLRTRFPNIRAPRQDDICYATQNRQDAVKKMAARCDLILVVGSQTSSNSNRLCEVAQQAGTHAYLVNDAAEMQEDWLCNVAVVGVTAGASAPDALVRDLVRWLKLHAISNCVVQEMSGAEENIVFMAPKSLLQQKIVERH
jgi:4-hydroxy-3-methylbut-2-enyl diphosphate reductase